MARFRCPPPGHTTTAIPDALSLGGRKGMIAGKLMFDIVAYHVVL
jgi:hypothetical protein